MSPNLRGNAWRVVRRCSFALSALLFAILLFFPVSANAWWISQPRFEKQVVTEGDPEDPGIAAPNGPSAPVSAQQYNVEITEIMLTILTETLGL